MTEQAISSIPESDESTEYDDAIGIDTSRGLRGLGLHTNHGQAAGVVEGDQVLSIHQYFRRCTEYLELSDSHVVDCVRVFVPPRLRRLDGAEITWQEADSLLNLEGGVVLLGDHGTGRHTAAVNLLAHTGLPLHTARAAEDEQPDLPSAPPANPQAQLLELDRYASPRGTFAEDFLAYRTQLRSVGGRLVMTSTRDRWLRAGDLRDASVLVVTPPPPSTVLRAHLSELVPLSDEQIDQVITETLPRDATPTQAVRLAAVLHEVASEDDVLTAAVNAYQNWRADLAAWFTRNPDSRTRAFLIATAVLEGASGGQVLASADELARQLGEGSAAAPLGSPGIHELAGRIGAAVDETGHIRFAQPRYASAVLDFVVDDRSSEFGRRLWAWVASVPRGRRQRRTAEQVAEIALEASLRKHTAAPLSSLLLHWSESPTRSELLVEVLTVAALSREVGGVVRQRIYQWALNWGHVPSLCVIATICGDRFAEFYPGMALTRLGVLAQRQRPELTPAVADALRKIWEQPGLRRTITTRLTQWLGDPQRSVTAAGAFLAIAKTGPALLQATGTVVAPPMAAQLMGGSDSTMATVLERWLGQAAEDVTLAAHLFDLLDACAATGTGSARVVGVIRTVAYRWQPVSQDAEWPTRARLRERLLERLHQSGRTAASGVVA